MPVMIKLTYKNGKGFYYNATCICKICQDDYGVTEVVDKDGKRIRVEEKPEVIDSRIDDQIRSMRGE